MDDQRLKPNDATVRNLLRIVGPSIVAVGAVFLIVGISSFFGSIGTFEPPKYFWCAFVGMPLVAIGMGMSKFAFMGAIFRYMANETTPVAKETFNDLATGTQQGVRTIATAIAEGLRENASALPCAGCGQLNDCDARFCKSCGANLTPTCPSCGRVNDASARFCDACGKLLET